MLAVKQPAGDLERDEGVDAGVPDLLVAEAVRVPAAHGDPLRLREVHAHDGLHEGAQPRLAEVRAVHALRGAAAQVHRVGHLQAVVVAEPLRVRRHADAEEADPAVAEELRQRAGDVVGVEELEDEAAAAHAELQCGHRVLVRAVAWAPLDVEPDGDVVADAAGAVHREDLRDPAIHGLAGGCDGGGYHVVAEGHLGHVGIGHWMPRRRLSGCGLRAAVLLFSCANDKGDDGLGKRGLVWERLRQVRRRWRKGENFFSILMEILSVKVKFNGK